MSKLKNLPYSIINIYPFGSQLAVYFDSNEYQSACKELGQDIEMNDKMYGGTTSSIEFDGVNYFLVHLLPSAKMNIIYHESLHAAWYLLDHHGVYLCADANETLAYMQGYIADQLFEILVKYRKENK